jgi:hypothetical protein
MKWCIQFSHYPNTILVLEMGFAQYGIPREILANPDTQKNDHSQYSKGALFQTDPSRETRSGYAYPKSQRPTSHKILTDILPPIEYKRREELQYQSDW